MLKRVGEGECGISFFWVDEGEVLGGVFFPKVVEGGSDFFFGPDDEPVTVGESGFWAESDKSDGSEVGAGYCRGIGGGFLAAGTEVPHEG